MTLLGFGRDRENGERKAGERGLLRFGTEREKMRGREHPIPPPPPPPMTADESLFKREDFGFLTRVGSKCRERCPREGISVFGEKANRERESQGRTIGLLVFNFFYVLFLYFSFLFFRY